jgi:transposase-like protein
MLPEIQDPDGYWVTLRWPNGVACPLDCGSVNVDYMPKQFRWYCRDCQGQFTAKVGTIFEGSKLEISVVIPMLWMLMSGIPTTRIARTLGVTQKTVWLTGYKVRLALSLAGQAE